MAIVAERPISVSDCRRNDGHAASTSSQPAVHFDAIHFAKADGRPHCLYCVTLHDADPTRESPFCSEKCAASFSAAQANGSQRTQLFARERGVCQSCGFDAHGLYRRVAALSSMQSRMQLLLGSPFSSAAKPNSPLITDPKEGAFWQADHIVSVEEGGGESDLTNLQTLCVPCHTKKTAEQAQRRAKRKRDDAAAGSGDLRSWFAKKA